MLPCDVTGCNHYLGGPSRSTPVALPTPLQRDSGSNANRDTYTPPVSHSRTKHQQAQESPYQARHEGEWLNALPHLFGRDCKPSNPGSKQSVARNQRKSAIERQSALPMPSYKSGPFGANGPHPPTPLRIPRTSSPLPRPSPPSRATFYLS